MPPLKLFSRLILRRLFSLFRGEKLLPLDGDITLPERGWYLVSFQANVDPISAKNILELSENPLVSCSFFHNGITDYFAFVDSPTTLATELATLVFAQKVTAFDARIKLFLSRRRAIESSRYQNLSAGDGANNFRESRMIDCLTVSSGQTYREILKKLKETQLDFMFISDGSITMSENSEAVLSDFLDNNDVVSFDYHQEVQAVGLLRGQYTPELNLPYLLCYDYIKGCYVVRREVLIKALSALPADDEYHQHQLILAIVCEGSIRSKRVAISLATCLSGDRQILDAKKVNYWAKKIYPNAKIQPKTNDVFGLSLAAPEGSRASIIIPAKDQLAYTRRCVESILEKTHDIEYEILLVNNDSVEQATLEWLASISDEPRVNVIDYPYPFNFSAINNFAVTRAKYEYLVFLNNDTEVITENWLQALVGWASVDGMGAVGCKLHYEDGRIQHAGVVVGIQNAAAHVHRFYQPDHSGYMNRLDCPQHYSAVTAAALAIKRDVFNKVGGFDEEKYKVAYNDVDICLKCQSMGFKNVWVADVSLYHYESMSRDDDLSLKRLTRYSKELDTLRRDWGVSYFDDPWYNPNLTQIDEYFH
jgi:GT2 family glycosyltransferase